MAVLQNEIRRRYQLYPASHLTHIENLPAIAAAVALQSYNRMRGQAYFNLANEDVQAGRAAILVPGDNRPLHDFVPLYFGFKTPMVACNQHHNEAMIFLRFPLDFLGAITGIVITDGNARSRQTRFKPYQTIDDLQVVNAKAVQTVKYAHDPELKRCKQAEILVPDQLSLSWMTDVICFSPAAKTRVIDIFQKTGIRKSVIVNPGWYFLPAGSGA